MTNPYTTFDNSSSLKVGADEFRAIVDGARDFEAKAIAAQG